MGMWQTGRPAGAKGTSWGARAPMASMAVVMAVCFCALPVQATDLQVAYQAALTEDATLRAARAAKDAARERVPQARAPLLPNVSYSAGRNQNDLDRTQQNPLGQTLTTKDNYQSFNQTLQVRQPLFRKALWVGLEQAEWLVEEAKATLERENQNLAVRVTETYLEALLAQDQLDLVLKQRDVTRVQLDMARKALVAGSGTRTDIDEAQARLDMNVAQELEARQQLDITRQQLEVMTQRPAGALARLDAKKMLMQAPAANLQAWLALAENESPEIRGLKARLESARLDVSKAQAGHYPTLDAVAQVTRSASENVTALSSNYTNRMVGLQLNLPLSAGGQVNSAIRQALAEQTRAEENLEATRRDLAMRLHKEFRGVTEGVLKVAALTQAVKSAEQLVVSSRRSLQAGTRTVIDILNAEQQAQVAQRDLAQARYAYLLSRVRLQALAGGDMASAITEINGWMDSASGPERLP